MRFSLLGPLGSAALVLCLPLLATAADASRRTGAKAPAETVELFAAMKSGDIEVKVIPKDSTEAAITIKNKTGKPLTIKVPPALAAVPVQAQFGGGGMMGGGMGMPGVFF